MEGKKYVLEYSPLQKSYNIDTFENIIKKNNEMFKKGTFNGYIPIAYSNSISELYEIADIYVEKYDRP